MVAAGANKSMSDYIDDEDPLEGTEGAGLDRIARPPKETMPPLALRGLGPVPSSDADKSLVDYGSPAARVAAGGSSSSTAPGSTEDLEDRGIASHTGPRALVTASPNPSPEPIGSTEDLENRGLTSHTIPQSIATPSPLEQRTQADQKELGRLTSTGSGISQIKNPFARGTLRGLETVGNIFVPGQMGFIPGTEAHHQALIGQSRGRIGEDLGEAKQQATTDETTARTDQANAAAEKDRADAAARLNPTAKEGLTPEEKTIHDLMTGENGQPRVNPQTGKPYSYLEAYAATKQASQDVKPDRARTTREITRVVNGVPHTVMVDAETGADIKDEGQTKLPGESPDQKRSAQESAQVEREARTNIRKAESGYRDTQKSVGQLKSAIDAASDGNGLLTSFVPTMEVLGINASNGVHRISPAEAEAAQLPGGWAEQFNAWLNKSASGTISPQLKAEGKQLADILVKSSYQRYKSTYDDESGMVEGYGGKDFSKRVRVIPEDAGAGGNTTTAAKDLGPAPQGKAEGATGSLPDGTKVVIKNGRIVAQ